MPDQPNILLILTDQHRLSAVGAYGETVCQTPNIDRLAEEGIRFENTYTACPVCSPARGTIMTGCYPHSHGIVSNIHNLGTCVHELQDRPELLSRQFEANGYSVGYSGKWHLGSDQTTAFGAPNNPSLPRDVGFEGQNFPNHGGGGFGYPEYQKYLSDNGYEHTVKPWGETTQPKFGAGELAGPIESTVPYFLTQHTMDLIDDFQKRESPFFHWHNFWGPHGPYYAPEEFLNLYRNVEIPPWSNYTWPSRTIPGPHHVKIHPDHERLSWEDWEMAIRYYYAFTSLIDSQIGRLMGHLKSTGILDNTIVIFSADHGETLGSHGGLTDKGWHHFEEIHRIPLIVRFPDSTGAGQVRSQFASLADLYPTLLDLAGASWDSEAVHGTSLTPLMSDPSTAWRDTVVSEFGGVNSLAITMRTLRHGNLKFGYNCVCEDELYDLESDPDETRNLINHPDYLDAAQDLRQRLLAWMAETQDPLRNRYENALNYYDRA